MTKVKTPVMFPPSDPIREVLLAMTGVEPPPFVEGYNFDGLDNEERHMEQLQDWACINVKPSWLTGIGLLEAAEQQVAEAVANGNIPPDKYKNRFNNKTK
jgi:hypothetical protein